MRKSIDINAASALLAAGGAVIVDTDTVAGIAVSTNAPNALGALYEAKSREARKPVAWLVSGADDLERYGDDVPDYAFRLARQYWPGALTLVVKTSDAVDTSFAAENGTIGLRMPDSETCLSLAKALGCPIAATSANMSGAPAPRFAKDVDPGFAAGVPALMAESLALKCCPSQATASTVIDCSSSRPSLVREGTIPFSEIVDFIDETTGEVPCE